MTQPVDIIQPLMLAQWTHRWSKYIVSDAGLCAGLCGLPLVAANVATATLKGSA